MLLIKGGTAAVTGGSTAVPYVGMGVDTFCKSMMKAVSD